MNGVGFKILACTPVPKLPRGLLFLSFSKNIDKSFFLLID